MWKRSFVFVFNHISIAFKTCLCILNFSQAFEALTYEVVLQTAPGKVKENLNLSSLCLPCVCVVIISLREL